MLERAHTSKRLKLRYTTKARAHRNSISSFKISVRGPSTKSLSKYTSFTTESPCSVMNPFFHTKRLVDFCRMLHHVLVMRLFHPFTHYESPNAQVESYRSQALQRITTAMNELRHLIYLHDYHFGWSNIIDIVLYPLVTVVFASLDETSQEEHPVFLADRSEVYRGLLTCLHALSIVSTYHYCVQPVLRLLAQSCQSLDIPLPEEITNALSHFESEEWTRQAVSMASSQYIADMREATLAMDSARMDSIVSRWGTLTIEDVRNTERR